MTRSNGEDFGCALMAILAILALILGYFSVLDVFQDTRTCVSGGYAGYETFNSTRICVGIRDGEYVVESLEQVRIRVENELR